MNGLLVGEIVILVILLVGLIRGYMAGLLGGLVRLMGLVLAIWLAPVLVSAAEPWLPEVLYRPLPQLFLFLAAFLVIAALAGLAGKLVSKLLHWTPLAWIDKSIGALAGLFLSLLLVSVLLNLAESFGFLAGLTEIRPWEQQTLSALLGLAPTLVTEFRDWLPGFAERGGGTV